MTTQETQEEVSRLKSLLKGKKEEYKIFGKTSFDAEKDFEISLKIKELELIIN